MDLDGLCHDFRFVSRVQGGYAVSDFRVFRYSFLLLAGRLADLYPAQYVFEGGFVTLAIFFLVSSFGESLQQHVQSTRSLTL